MRTHLLFALIFFSSLQFSPGKPLGAGIQFEPNLGQADPSVRFVARTPAGIAFLLENGIAIATPGAKSPVARPDVVEMRFAGAHPRSIVSEETGSHATNYFLGAAATQAKLIPSYRRVRYRQLWPGIDAVVYGAGSELEYDFIVSPGADPSQIALLPSGAEWSIGANGDLVLERGANTRLVNRRPDVYQVTGGRRERVEGKFEIRSDRTAGFVLGAYDARRPLVIDPVISISSLAGGAGFDLALGVAVDNRGFIYLSGYTLSSNFPVVNSIPRPQRAEDYWDAYLIKLNPHTRSIVYSAVFGGRYNEYAAGVAVDEQGSAYVVGTTNSDNFPVTAGALQRTYAGGHAEGDTIVVGDAFVAKFDPTGARLTYSTFLGAAQKETGVSIVVDQSGSAYVAGVTDSASFPVKSAAQATFGGFTDTFIAKLSPDGASIVVSTFMGGRGGEGAGALALDATGNIYFAGSTQSDNLATTANAAQARGLGGSEGFLVKVSPTGSLLFSTYMSTVGADTLTSTAVAPDGSIWVAGTTTSESFPVTSDAAQKTHGGGPLDVVVARYLPDGTRMTYATYIGAEGRDADPSIGVDGAGRVFVTFDTSSKNLAVTADALQRRNAGINNLALARLSPSLSAFEHLTYWGSSGTDNVGFAVHVDRFSNVYFAGNTDSDTFPKIRTVQEFAGQNDAVVVKVVFGTPRLTTTPASPVAFKLRAGATGTQMVTVASATGPIGFTVGIPPSATWLSAESATGIAPVTVSLRASAGSLPAGSYNATVTLNSPEFPGLAEELRVTLEIEGGTNPSPDPAVRLAANGIRNAASYASASISPGLIATLFGERIGPPVLVGLRLDGEGKVANELAGTRILFDGVAAPIIYASAGQTSVIVPYDVAGKSRVSVIVEFEGVRSTPVEIPVTPSVPGLFTANASGTGPGAFLNQDGSLNTSDNPAGRGTVVTLYATGEGQTVPEGVDGRPAAGDLPKPVLPVSVRIGDTDAEVLYAGAAPGLVAGLMQINVRIPAQLTAGSVAVTATAGTAASQSGVTVFVK